MPESLRDRFGRSIDNLRVSVTDRCNLRCRYCLPADGLRWLPPGQILTFEEIALTVRALAGLGIRKVRLTGGEPLVRRDLPTLVAKLAAVPGLDDLALTTNGIFLADQAEDLARAGLQRVNVSLDALTPEAFQEVARRPGLERVLHGLDAAAKHFPGPLKINTVLVRGLNDHQAPDFAELARRRGAEVRFIEFMPLDADGAWSRDALVPGAEIRSRIAERHALAPDPDADPRAPSRDWIFADGAPGKVGFIDSVTAPFCSACNRVRLTADGKLRTCLFSTRETDLMPILRAGASDSDITAALEVAVRRAVWEKEPGHGIGSPEFVDASRSMSQIGG